MQIQFKKIKASKVNNYAYNLKNKQNKALLEILALSAIAVNVLPGAHSMATSVHRQTYSCDISGQVTS